MYCEMEDKERDKVQDKMETKDREKLIDYRKVNVYQGVRKILGEVDFSVYAGDFIYLIGKVGSGKSSLLKTMYAELDVYADGAERAEVLGRDMVRLRRREVPALRREMGIIFQDFQLLSDRSVRRNLDFVLRATRWRDRSARSERIYEVLAQVGMEDKIDAMPYALSGGEQQRIAIARALLNTPRVIIADEPTGNLDPDTAAQIVSLLKSISETGTAVVMSTHNWAMIEQYPGGVYRCADGQVYPVTYTQEEAATEDESTSQDESTAQDQTIAPEDQSTAQDQAIATEAESKAQDQAIATEAESTAQDQTISSGAESTAQDQTISTEDQTTSQDEATSQDASTSKEVAL